MISPIRCFVSITLCAVLYSPIYCCGQLQFLKPPGPIQYSHFKGEAGPEKNQLEFLGKQARWDDAGGNQNPNGVHLRFAKIDDQKTPEGHTVARYRIFAEGAPENKIFALTSWLLEGEYASGPRDLYVNAQGLLMYHKPNPDQRMLLKVPADEVVVMPDLVSAEPMRYRLSSMDGELKIFGTVVPHPVVAEEAGCRLEARIAEANAKTVLIIVDGFPAKSKIPLVLESEGKTDSEVLTADLNGNAVIAVAPAVQGKTQGILKATAEGNECVPSLVLPWGPFAPPATPAAKAPAAPAPKTP
jgi:hypothetical protein